MFRLTVDNSHLWIILYCITFHCSILMHRLL